MSGDKSLPLRAFALVARLKRRCRASAVQAATHASASGRSVDVGFAAARRDEARRHLPVEAQPLVPRGFKNRPSAGTAGRLRLLLFFFFAISFDIFRSEAEVTVEGPVFALILQVLSRIFLFQMKSRVNISMMKTQKGV